MKMKAQSLLIFPIEGFLHPGMKNYLQKKKDSYIRSEVISGCIFTNLRYIAQGGPDGNFLKKSPRRRRRLKYQEFNLPSGDASSAVSSSENAMQKMPPSMAAEEGSNLKTLTHILFDSFC